MGARGEALLVFWVSPNDLMMTSDLTQVELVNWFKMHKSNAYGLVSYFGSKIHMGHKPS